MRKVNQRNAVLALLAFAIAIGAVACAAITGSDTGNTPYTISVNVTGSKAHVDYVAVCLTYSNQEGKCSPAGGFLIGTTGQITTKSNPGVSYSVTLPTGQPAAGFCSVSAGGSGVFGSSMPTAVVTCT